MLLNIIILKCFGSNFSIIWRLISKIYFNRPVFFFLLFQSDIIHQSVYELVHSEDREELQKQLMWNSFLPTEQANITLQEAILPENCHLLERNFTVRFRCLLDNTSGFLVSRLFFSSFFFRYFFSIFEKCDSKSLSSLSVFAIFSYCIIE